MIDSKYLAGGPTVSAQEDWRLEQSEVELLASKQFPADAVVSVMSILCNWGAPVSGRYDPDFLDIWVAADDSFNPRSVALCGCEAAGSYSYWRDIGEFVKSKTADINGRAVCIYHFSGPPVDEFVVRLTDHRGEYHYDNNGGFGVNYHLGRYRGFQLTCVRTATQFSRNFQNQRNWILVFPKLIQTEGTEGVARVSLKE